MEGKRPFISVVMPVYNAEEYLEKSITSILEQTFQDFELVIINDCSKDNSKSICLRFAKDNKKIKFLDLKENVGAGAARNYGIEHATGYYLAFVDSDDKIATDLFEQAVLASEEGKIDMVVWGMTELYLNRKGEVNHIKIVQSEKGTWRGEKIAKKILELEEKTLLGYQCNKLYKKSIVDTMCLRFEKSILYEDYFFTLKFCEHIHSITYIEHAGYFYYKRFNESITTRFVPEYYQLSKRRIEEMYGYCKKEGILESSIQVLNNIYIRYILSAATRNEDKRCKLNRIQKKQWLYKVSKDKLYLEICSGRKTKSITLNVFKWMMEKNLNIGCRIISKGIYKVKKYGPLLFSKIK
ncbi:glycosyltransferase family 2 protein [Lachnoclostridium sp. An181]|uniref:glycosyltransferase family 2 protein n=1 Tax=Lachnoclostridium sp. An181 TaxID=1965575 RepID=UPI000B38F95D|nr:glycosyltransferase family 2 protein [Lachnoclostridium sp. An181]OUP49744.1 hypothetical protein B5F18_06945 [Lachnoclostridium sp. An181]